MLAARVVDEGQRFASSGGVDASVDPGVSAQASQAPRMPRRRARRGDALVAATRLVARSPPSRSGWLRCWVPSLASGTGRVVLACDGSIENEVEDRSIGDGLARGDPRGLVGGGVVGRAAPSPTAASPRSSSDGRHGRRPSRHRECVRARPRPGRRRREPPRAARPCPAPPLSSSSTAATTPPQQRSLRPAGTATVRARPARARPRPAARWRAAPPPSSSRTRSATSSVRAAPAPPPDSPSSGTSSRTGPRADHTRCSPLAAAGPHRARLRTSASTSSTAGDVPPATSNSPRRG